VTMQAALSPLRAVWRKPSVCIIISLLLVSLLLTQLPFPDLWQTVQWIPVQVWLLALVVFIAGHVIAVLKWALLINMRRNRLPLSITLRCHFPGLSANLFLPSLGAGDIVHAGMGHAVRSRKGGGPSGWTPRPLP